jgi:hypothetical protein
MIGYSREDAWPKEWEDKEEIKEKDDDYYDDAE